MPENLLFDAIAFADNLHARAADMADRMQELVRDFAPVYVGPDPNHQGGGLRDSIEAFVILTPEGFAIGVSSNKDYVRYVIEGTAPHEIWPQTPGGKLRWWVAGNEVRFAPMVYHPGTAPNPFADRAMVAINEMIDEEIANVWRQARDEGGRFTFGGRP